MRLFGWRVSSWPAIIVCGAIMAAIVGRASGELANDSWARGVALAVVMLAALVGRLLSEFKRVNQRLYGHVESIGAGVVTFVCASRLVKQLDTPGADRWASMATLLGAVYLFSRSSENVRLGNERRGAGVAAAAAKVDTAKAAAGPMDT